MSTPARRIAALPRRLGAAAAVALALLAAPEAGAQVPGDPVHIETDAGPIDGTLVDRVPDGYLVRVGGKNRIVPYTSVKSISRGGAPPVAPPSPSAPPSPAAPPSPVPLGPAPAPLPPLPGGATVPGPGAPPPSPAPPPSWPPAPPPSWPPAPPPSSPVPYYSLGAPPPPPAGGPRQAVFTPVPVVVQPKRPANAYTIAGVTTLSLGLAGVVAGVVLIPTGAIVKAVDTCQDATQVLVTYSCDLDHGGRLIGAGAAALAVGGVLMLASVPLLIAGDKKSRRPAGTGAVVPTFLASPGSAALRWRF
jgi:hypothetical protein